MSNPVTKNGMRSFKTKIENNSAIKCIDEHSVHTCPKCEGIGWYTETEYDHDYRGSETKTRVSCSDCAGDGRIVLVSRRIEFDGDQDQHQKIPFSEFKGDPWYQNQIIIGVKMDFRNKRLEDKYPELKSKSYDEYDKSLQKYETLDRIDNPERWNKNGQLGK